MLSPSDFIFNDDFSPPYYLETQHFINSEPGLNSIFYFNPLNKITNPYSTDTVKISSLPQTDLYEIYQDYLKNVLPPENKYVESNPYFPGVRFLSPGIVVFERPPMYQVVDIDNDYRDNINDNTSTSQYYLPIPWQAYICTYNPNDMRLNSVKMLFLDSFLSDVDQEAFCPPMFNFYSNGNLCRPFFATIDDIEKYSQDINGIIASAYDWVWNSGFNFDITENISQFLSSKKFEEFSPWAEDKSPKSIQFLREHPIYGLPRITNKSYIDHLFKCWESVPLDQISSIKWSSFTKSEFFYQEINDISSNFFYEYISSNNIIICEDYDEDIHDSEYYEHECDDCISEEALRESEEYQRAFLEATVIPSKSIKAAIEDSIAQTSHFVSNKVTHINFLKSFINIHEKYFS